MVVCRRVVGFICRVPLFDTVTANWEINVTSLRICTASGVQFADLGEIVNLDQDDDVKVLSKYALRLVS